MWTTNCSINITQWQLIVFGPHHLSHSLLLKRLNISLDTKREEKKVGGNTGVGKLLRFGLITGEKNHRSPHIHNSLLWRVITSKITRRCYHSSPVFLFKALTVVEIFRVFFQLPNRWVRIKAICVVGNWFRLCIKKRKKRKLSSVIIVRKCTLDYVTKSICSKRMKTDKK